jgi:hypothetical protein
MRTRNLWPAAIVAALAMGLALASGACAADDADGAPDDETSRALAPIQSAGGPAVALPDGGAGGTGATAERPARALTNQRPHRDEGVHDSPKVLMPDLGGQLTDPRASSTSYQIEPTSVEIPN